MSWYLTALKKYAVFSGRACRKEYWMFFLVNFIIYLVFYVLMFVEILGDGSGVVAGLLYGLYYLGVLIPYLAVSIRRLHDTNRSGWWFLIGLVPLVGGIILLIFLVEDGDPGENEYGPNPKLVEGGPQYLVA